MRRVSNNKTSELLILFSNYKEFLGTISVISFNYINFIFIFIINDFQKEENNIEFSAYKIVKWDINHKLYL